MMVISAKITLQSLVCFWWWWSFSSLSLFLSLSSRTWMFGVNRVMICNKKILQCWNFLMEWIGWGFVTRRFCSVGTFGGVNWARICNKKILQCWNSWWSVLGGKSFVTRRVWGVLGGWVGIL
jgi:hypothetical protein